MNKTITLDKNIIVGRAPILNLLLKSKVIAGAKTKETFSDKYKNTISITSSRESKKSSKVENVVLHKSGFEFYAKCIRLINENISKDNTNINILEIDVYELMEDFGVSLKNKTRPIIAIQDKLKDFTTVQVTCTNNKGVVIYHFNLLGGFLNLCRYYGGVARFNNPT